jgi:hypothetical protein
MKCNKTLFLSCTRRLRRQKPHQSQNTSSNLQHRHSGKRMRSQDLIFFLLSISHTFGRISFPKLNIFSLLPQQQQPQSLSISSFEQSLDDLNNQLLSSNFLQRRLIALSYPPIQSSSSSMISNSRYLPSKYHSLYSKEQFCDKCALPQSLSQELSIRSINGPWLWEIKKHSLMDQSQNSKLRKIQQQIQKNQLSKNPPSHSSPSSSVEGHPKGFSPFAKKIYGSTLDYRAPENYIFLPQWMMRSLNATNYDLLDIKFLSQLPSVSSVILQPWSPKWKQLHQFYDSNDLNSILEKELERYSTLTCQTTIPLSINDEIFEFHVKECRDANGINRNGVMIQDQDMITVIDESLIEKSSKDSFGEFIDEVSGSEDR